LAPTTQVWLGLLVLQGLPTLPPTLPALSQLLMLAAVAPLMAASEITKLAMVYLPPVTREEMLYTWHK